MAIGSMVRLGLLRLLARLSSGGLKRLALYSLRTRDPGPLLEVLSRTPGTRCPPREVVEALASLGIYEEVVRLSLRGCSVDKNVLERAKRAFVVLGLPKWERAAAGALGKKPISGSGGVLYLYCSANRVAVMAGDQVIDPNSDLGGAAARLGLSSVDSVINLVDPDVVVHWNCRVSHRRTVDAKMLIAASFPDVRPSIADIAHHLDVNADSPVEVVSIASRISVWLLESVGIDWRLVPRDLYWAHLLEPLRPPVMGREVVITDRPRLVYPIYKPYVVEAEKKGSGDPLLYLAGKAVEVLGLRRGDPSRAIAYSRRYRRLLGADDLLVNMLVSGIRGRRGLEGLDGGFQVEPWDLGCLPWGEVPYDSIVVDCIANTEECINPGANLPPHEAEVIGSGVRLPCRRESGIASGFNGLNSRIIVRSRKPLPVRLSSAIGVEAPRVTRIVASLGSLSSNDPESLMAKALGMVSAKRGLIVVPSRLLVGGGSGIIGISSDADVDEWVDSEAVGVVDWDYLRYRPELLSWAKDVVSVLPEEMAKTSLAAAKLLDGDEYFQLDYHVDRAAELAAGMGGKTVSRALEGAGLDYVDLRDPGVSDGVARNRPGPHDYMEEFRGVFRRFWGIDSLRPGQELALRVVARFLAYRKPGILLSVLPTGYGKSAIFQVAAKVAVKSGLGGFALVVSPLKALMRDQVRKAVERGFYAVNIDSSVPPGVRARRIRAAMLGVIDLIYVTPERFEDPIIDELLSAATPSLIVLDEAHTIVRWGPSFRPSYLYMAKKIVEGRGSSKWPPILAFTATAPNDVKRGLLQVISGSTRYIRLAEDEADRAWTVDLEPPIVVQASPVRREITVDVIPSPSEKKLETLASLVKDLVEWSRGFGDGWVGVVFTGYVKSRRDPSSNAEYLASYLSRIVDVDVRHYHGQMSDAYRRAVEEELVSASKSGVIVVATKAFGMGVDVPNIRWVIHYSPSDSLEDYIQEIGRASRDGKPGMAVLLYSPDDFKAKESLIRREAIRPSMVLEALNRLYIASQAYSAKTAVIPLDYIPGRIKSLDTLRSAGVIDYWLARGLSVARGGEGGYIAMTRSGYYLAAGGDGSRARFYSCTEPPGFRLAVDDRDILSVGGCREGVPYEGSLAVVEWHPGWMPSRLEYLPPSIFELVVRSYAVNLEKLSAYKSIVESVVAARSRGGRSAANAEFRRLVEEYFASSKPLARSGLESILPRLRVRECRLEECIEEASRLIHEARSVLGDMGVYVAVQSPELGEELSKAYVKVGGGRLSVSPGAYRLLINTLRNRGVPGLMDKGFAVVIVSHERRSRAVERLKRVAAEYPYLVVYLIKR